MQLEFESGLVLKDPTEKDLARIADEEFAIISREGWTYMQCAQNSDESSGEFVLEYQEGSLDQHYHAVDGPVTLERVKAAFGKYLRGDASWRDDFEWERMVLE